VLLAYGSHDEAALRDYAAMQAAGAATHADVARALPLDTLEVKPMPPRWTEGRLLQFETRVRPVVRTSRNDPNGQNRGPNSDKNGGREIDAFLSAMEKAGGNLQAGGAPLDRQSVYRSWVSDALTRNGAASLTPDDIAIKALKRTRLHTGDNRPVDDAVGGKVEGPDIVAEGLLRVGDPAAFAALLARGLGRHRAFGFGMLLLAPPARGA
jgi:CRISPR system Cascade subunit CasE